jgi:non-lysosomal glucosylceramidase
MSKSQESIDFSIPTCAWKRPIGSCPEKANQVMEMMGNLTTPARTKKGIPLGGIGAGNFMYNLCGSFGPWHMKPGKYEERFLPQAAFHVREQVGEKVAHQRTLATEDVLPAWKKLEVGEGTYAALFPRGWCTYRGFETEITLEFFSPLIKENYRETSLPVAMFLFRLKNPKTEPAKVSVMFTFPNAPYTGPHNLNLELTAEAREQTKTLPENIQQMLIGFKGMLSASMIALAKERQGLKNELVLQPEDGFTAILMKANDPANSPETQDSEWCIATSSSATYNPAWDGAGDGSDIWAEFARDGNLNNRPSAPGSKLPSGAVAVEVTLQPGEEAVVPFALAWYFPQVEFGAGTRWWRRFTEYFPAQSGAAAAIAKEALQEYPAWLAGVEGWTNPIINNPAYPDWLKAGALNELYYATFGGSFWENGCITKPKKFGARPGQHLSFTMECQEYRMAETFDVRHHISRTTRELWPGMERDLLLVFADFTMDSPKGNPPHDAGGPDADPFFLYDYYALMDPNKSDKSITWTEWSEYAPKLIQQSYAYWHKTHDTYFLKEAWPAMVRAYHFQKSTDTDGDGITEMKSSEYANNKLFNAVLWIGALEGMLGMAKEMKDEVTFADAQAQLALARKSSEQQFWNEELGYYQFNAEKELFMGDAFIGQLYMDVTGLPPTLTPERMTSHYLQGFARAVKPFIDTDGDGVGNLGVANAVHPDSSPGTGASEFQTHEFEAWTGVSYAFAACMAHWGKRVGNSELQKNALLTGWGVYQTSWLNEDTCFWFSTPEAWRIAGPTFCRALMYQRARAIWELMSAVQDPYK